MAHSQNSLFAAEAVVGGTRVSPIREVGPGAQLPIRMASHNRFIQLGRVANVAVA